MTESQQQLLSQATAFDQQMERLQDRCEIMKACAGAMKPEQLVSMVYDTVDCMSNGIIVLRNMFSRLADSMEKTDAMFIELAKRHMYVEQEVAEIVQELETDLDTDQDNEWWQKGDQ